jgi:hypothetical protein
MAKRGASDGGFSDGIWIKFDIRSLNYPRDPSPGSANHIFSYGHEAEGIFNLHSNVATR